MCGSSFDDLSAVCHIYRYLGFSVIKWESLCNQDGMDTTNTSILVWIPLWTDNVLWLTTLDDLGGRRREFWGLVGENKSRISCMGKIKVAVN